jgi:hypothetical protein
MRLPGVTGCQLPEVLATGIIDLEVFQTGCAVIAARYEQLGIRDLLPLERGWAGTRSTADPGTTRSHGGFYHPAQGYRHPGDDGYRGAYPGHRVTECLLVDHRRPVCPRLCAGRRGLIGSALIEALTGTERTRSQPALPHLAVLRL